MPSTTWPACSPSASSRSRRGGPCWAETASGSSRCTWPSPRGCCASPPRCPRLLAAGGRRPHRRPRRAPPLPDLPRHRARRPARSCAASQKLPPATLRIVEPDGARRERPLLGHPDRPRRRRPGAERGRLGRPRGGAPAGRRAAAPRGRRPRGRAALGRPRLQPDRGAAGRGGPDGPADVQHRLRVRRRRGGRRVPLVRRRGRALRAPTTTASRCPPTDVLADVPAADRGDERADGQPRRGGVLPPLPRGGEAREGRAVGPGRRRGVRRLPLVPDARRRAGRRPRRATPRSFFDRDDGEVAAVVGDRLPARRTTPAGPSWPRHFAGLARCHAGRAGAPHRHRR